MEALTKTCPKCKIPKEFRDFNKSKDRKDGLQRLCKKCAEDYYLKNREKINLRRKDFRSRNKEELAMKQKTYRSEHREEDMARCESYRVKNRNQLAEKSRNYYFENKKKIKERCRKYSNERKKTDINFRLACQIRSRLLDAIKNNFKSGSAVRDLGCTIQEFKSYLEGQFQDGMTWDNWTRFDLNPMAWNIDHKTPLSLFDLTNRNQFLQAVHYTNQWPMWAKENLRKGSRENFNVCKN